MKTVLMIGISCDVTPFKAAGNTMRFGSKLRPKRGRITKSKGMHSAYKVSSCTRWCHTRNYRG